MSNLKLGQPKSHTAIEAVLNIGSGMFLAFGIYQLAGAYAPEIRMYIWSGFELDIGLASNALMTVVLTFVSMARSYTWRRVFNRFHEKYISKLLKGKNYAE